MERNLFLCIGWVSHRAATRHGIVKEGCRTASNGCMIGFFRQQAGFGFSPTPKTGTYEYPDSQYHGIQCSHEPQHGDCVSHQPLYTPEDPHPPAASIVALTSKQLPTQAYSPESEWSRTIHTRRISMLPTNPTHNKPALMIRRGFRRQIFTIREQALGHHGTSTDAFSDQPFPSHMILCISWCGHHQRPFPAAYRFAYTVHWHWHQLFLVARRLSKPAKWRISSISFVHCGWSRS